MRSRRLIVFYFSADPELGIDALEGVVTFPSVHLITGLIVVAMWRWNVVALALASGWFGFMLLSTLPYGGHYIVDLLGGALVWACWFALSKRATAAAIDDGSNGRWVDSAATG